jgi:RES domain-containing protein
MLTAWRIVKAKHAATAFSGDGAAKMGGRWNSRGARMVYASASKSLAVLETLVHLNPPVAFQYVGFAIEFDASLVTTLATAKLPVAWRKEPPPSSTQALGDAWLAAGSSAILAVPSVILPSETNYLLNPAHPDFSKIKIAKPEPFAFDPRLLT